MAKRIDQTGIERIGGRRPINSDYRGRVYDGPAWTSELASRYPDGVRFTDAGFPDFSPYARARIRLDGLTGIYDTDASVANRALGLRQTPPGLVWHHVEDGTTMILIPRDLHAASSASGTDLARVSAQYHDRIPADLLPVAHAEGGNLVCLSLGGHDRRAVYFWDHEEEAEEGEPPARRNLHRIADSFRDFAASLRPVSDAPASEPVARDAWIDPALLRELQEPGDHR